MKSPWGLLLFGAYLPIQKKVKGKISDTGGDPLPGATVQIKGSTRGVIADVDGNFEFDGVKANEILVVSYIGMETKELAYKGEGFLNIAILHRIMGFL